jgi:hypothetical protein
MIEATGLMSTYGLTELLGKTMWPDLTVSSFHLMTSMSVLSLQADTFPLLLAAIAKEQHEELEKSAMDSFLVEENLPSLPYYLPTLGNAPSEPVETQMT